MNNLVLVSLIVGFISLLLGIWLAWQLVTLNKLRTLFFSGNGAADLETVIHTLSEHITQLEQRQGITENELSNLRHNFSFAIQKIGVVRFNPFADGGGNFSFSIALLNSLNSGVIITSMHGREQNRIYTKKIVEGKSESVLTEEEEQAIVLANSSEHIT